MSDDEKMLLKHFNDVLATYPKEELEKKLKNFEQFKQNLPDYEGYLDKSFYAKNPYTNEMYSDEDFKKFTDAIDNVKNQKIKEAAIQKLPPDEAARLARAKAMGFDVDAPVYHGSPHSNIEEFIPSKTGMFGSGVYTTIDPNEAAQYARQNNVGQTETDTIYPLFTRGRILNRNNNQDVLDLYKEIDPTTPNIDLSGEWWKDPEKLKKWNKIHKKINEKLEQEGKNATIESMVRDSKLFSGIQDKNHRIIFDPKNIRSKFADFDPAKSDSSDISSFVESKPKSGVLGKAFKLADIYQAGSDISKGDIVNPAISAAEAAAPKLGAVASRGAPLLDLLRPTEMMTEEQAIEDEMRKPEQYRNFKKLKKLFSEE